MRRRSAAEGFAALRLFCRICGAGRIAQMILWIISRYPMIIIASPPGKSNRPALPPPLLYGLKAAGAAWRSSIRKDCRIPLTYPCYPRSAASIRWYSGWAMASISAR